MNRFHGRVYPTLLAIVCLFALVNVAFAQTFRGSIVGTISDPSGAMIAGVTVIITDVNTGQLHQTTSSSAGEFAFQDLPLGLYSAEANPSGFQAVRVYGIQVSAGTVYPLKLTSQVASTATSVLVSAASETLDTTSGAQTALIPTKAVLDVPLNGRDFTQFLALTPGYSGYSAGGGGSLNGARNNQTSWQIDGSDNNDPWWNIAAVNQGGVSAIAGILLPIDAIDQFSVVTQGNAESGRNVGGDVNVVVKSGTNSIHGSAYYFNRNEAFAAQTPFAPASSPKQQRRNQQYGFSAGGPLVKDRLFYFLSGEKQQFIFANVARSTEPSADYQQQATQLISTYNNAYGGYAVNPVSQALLATLWPANALTGDAAPNNYFSTGDIHGYSYNGLIKLDYTITSKNQLSARYFNGQGIQTAPVGSYLDYYFRVGPFKVQNYSVVLNSTLSDHLQNQAVIGVSWFNYVSTDQNHSFDPITLGLNTEVNQATLSGAPKITIQGFDPIGLSNPSGRNSIVAHLTDTLSYVVGKHEIRFGGEFRQSQLDEFYHSNARGTFTFDGSQGPWTTDPLPNVNPTDPNVLSLADFLLGYYRNASISRGDPERQVFVNSFNFFAQDSWRVMPKLTVNYGLRYDYFGPFHNGYKNLSTFVPATGGLELQGDGLSSIYPTDWKNFAPRLGFSYQPGSKADMVVRGTFGLFFDQPNLAPFFYNFVNNGGASGIQGNPIGPNPVSSINVSACSILNSAGQSTGHSSTCTIPTDGSPVFPSISVLGNSLYAASQNFRTPYTYNFSLNIEKSFGPNAVLQIGYVGSQSRRLMSFLDINQAAPLSGGANASRPYSQYGPINWIGTIGTSNYNALQMLLKTSNWHGLVSKITYTWAHALDESSNPSFNSPANSNDFKAEYGNGADDVRSSLAGFAVYSFPAFARGPKALTNGWETSALVTTFTGLPFTATDGQDISGTSEYSDRVDQIGNAYAGVSHALVGHSTVQWVNPVAFTNPAPGTFGTMRRNQLRGPGYGDVDLSLLKNTHITERVLAQLRFELFNTFNRTNLAPPNGTFGSGSFGQSTDTIGDYNGAPSIGPGEPFNMQIGLKIIF
jgi:Carboxypeptidase regulatory-like domain/TonB dependent receptor